MIQAARFILRIPVGHLKRQRHDAGPVDRKEIEAPEAKPRRLVSEFHERTKARHTGLVTGDELAIDDRRLGRNALERRARNRFV